MEVVNFLLPVYVSLVLRIFAFKTKGTYPFSLERDTHKMTMFLPG